MPGLRYTLFVTYGKAHGKDLNPSRRIETLVVGLNPTAGFKSYSPGHPAGTGPPGGTVSPGHPAG